MLYSVLAFGRVMAVLEERRSARQVTPEARPSNTYNMLSLNSSFVFALLLDGRQSAVDLTCDMVDRVGRGWVQPPQAAAEAAAAATAEGSSTGGGGGGGKASGGAADEGGGSGEASRLALLAECRQAFWGMDEVRQPFTN